MGTFTALTDADVAAIAAAFDVGPVRGWTAIPAGTINSNFAVDAAAGRFFLRVNEDKRPDDVEYEAALVAALAGAGVRTPVPRAARDGRRHAAHAGKLISLFPWVDGEHRCAAGVTAAHARAVGAALAGLHRAGAPLAAAFDRAGIYGFDAIAARYRGFRQLTDPVLAPAIVAIGEELAWLGARADARAALPRGIIHGDLFRDNVLFDDAAAPILIDFEQASSGALAYDLAVCLNAWCFGDDLDPALVRAMVDGYRDARPLAPQELAGLAAECRAAAMRFTVTRITDVYLRETVATRDFRRYLARLRRWRALGADGLAAWLA
jgi:homoserine kinase type II